MHRRTALLDYTGDRTGTTSVSNCCVSQVQAMAASPAIRAGRRTPGACASPHFRILVRDGQEAASYNAVYQPRQQARRGIRREGSRDSDRNSPRHPLEPFHTERRLESTTAEADAWVGRRVRAHDVHLSATANCTHRHPHC